MISDSAKQQLNDQGYLVLPGFLTPSQVREFIQRIEEIYDTEGALAGSEFKYEPGARRLANLVNKGEIFEKLIQTPEILEYMEAILGADLKLSSLNARSANPHGNGGQPLHADGGALPDERGYWVANSIWMLDDFTENNGALRVVPGSHRWRRLPEPGAQIETEVLVTGTAGTVVVMNAHMWHGATNNRTGRPRRAMHVYFTRGDKPQQQYQKLLVRQEVQDRLSPLGRKLLALDDPRNDEVSATGSGASGFLK